MLSNQAIAEFKALYKSCYGVPLTNEEAFEKATSLIRLYKAVFIPKMKMNHYEKTTLPKKNQR